MTKIKCPMRPEELWIIISTHRFDDISPYLQLDPTASLAEKNLDYKFKKTPLLFRAHFFCAKEIAESFIKLYELPDYFKPHRIIVTSG